ncbi:uncharacterized protein LOC120113659 [Hibiscus syriacus]|uniref:uncharacterized protein LOC120113659 n=1 Tax=Hibiscus syriacus TaxID=106335 RepID=UPI001922134B|nr:uncharacterized protein LOC120113659 [Hibiscus syriacus]
MEGRIVAFRSNPPLSKADTRALSGGLVKHDTCVCLTGCPNALPVGSRLKSVGFGDGICHKCSNGEETIIHVMRDCPVTLETLCLADLPPFIFLCTMNVWNNRNSFVHSDRLQSAWLLVTNAKILHQDYLRAISMGMNKQRSTNIVIRWTPPLEGVIKVNVDGPFVAERRLSAIGVVARDKCGHVCGGLAQSSVGCFEAGFAELSALLAGLE